MPAAPRPCLHPYGGQDSGRDLYRGLHDHPAGLGRSLEQLTADGRPDAGRSPGTAARLWAMPVRVGGERIGRSGRVAADRVGGEDRRADRPRPGSADQGRCCPAGRRSPARARPAAAARNNVPVTAKFPAWIQPRCPSARELTGWRSGRQPSRTAPSSRNTATKTGPAAAPQCSSLRVHGCGVPGMPAGFTSEA
jgi:hypothetical protein